jgi:hypothetical protein
MMLLPLVLKKLLSFVSIFWPFVLDEFLNNVGNYLLILINYISYINQKLPAPAHLLVTGMLGLSFEV